MFCSVMAFLRCVRLIASSTSLPAAIIFHFYLNHLAAFSLVTTFHALHTSKHVCVHTAESGTQVQRSRRISPVRDTHSAQVEALIKDKEGKHIQNVLMRQVCQPAWPCLTYRTGSWSKSTEGADAKNHGARASYQGTCMCIVECCTNSSWERLP